MMRRESNIPLMSARRRKRLQLFQRGSATVISLGPIEIWDGADLSLIRDTLFELIDDKGKTSVGIDMTWVKYIPSGFFGMLSDWHDRGIQVTLYSPQPNVMNMLWFRQFFADHGDGCHLLLSEPVSDVDEADDTVDVLSDLHILDEQPSLVDAMAYRVFSSIGQ